MNRPIPGEDYYTEDGKVVFTSSYLQKRGYCCDNNCRHCPYKEKDIMDKEQWFLVVDTEDYSGNFEREMTAYSTGVATEYAGEIQAQQFVDETGKEGLEDLIDLQDYEGTPNACNGVLWPTPGWFNDGLGDMYRTSISAEEREAALEKYNKKVRAYVKKYEGYSNLEEIAKLVECPAYLSVAIFFTREPTKEELDLIMSRSKKYALDNEVTITGFRLQKKITQHKLMREFPEHCK